MIRFLENHDEPRAASELAPEPERAVAVAVATLPGATLWHEGQFEGWHVRLPVFLGRRPDEPVDAELRAFYLALVAAAREVRHGDWSLCEAIGWPGDSTCEQLLTWCWSGPEGHRALVVVNDAPEHAAARVRLPWGDLAGRSWRLEDRLSGDAFERDGDELANEGLFVQLPPWGTHLLTWTAT